MPALPVIADVFRVALNWSASAGPNAVNVIHIEKASAASSDVWDDIEASVSTDMWLNVSNELQVLTVDITPLDGTTATDVFTPTTPADWVGQGSSDYIPGYSQVVSLRTPLRGRSHRGRVYLPGLPEAAQSFGLVGANVSETTAAWVAFRDALITAGSSFVVASYKLATASSVSSLSADSRAGVQRRRQERVAA